MRRLQHNASHERSAPPVLTTTDIVVAAGLENIGDRARVKHLRKETIETALTTIHRMADTAVDRMKTSAEPLPVILVGGGAILVSRDLQSASTVLRPEHSSVANAIGAAVAQVGGEVDRVFAVEGTTRDAVLGIAKREASDRAIAAPNRIRSRSSTSRTCRSPICRAMPPAFVSRRWAISPCARRAQ